jgi:acyl-coenzyme A thioesterase PaaI-like protein
MITPMSDQALQDQYGPDAICFGCGPANPRGLRIKSRPSRDDPNKIVCDWTPERHHEAFDGFLSGGIIGTLLDCHCNWTAAYHLMRRTGRAQVPFTVTAEYSIKMTKPTPAREPVHLSARVVDSTDTRAVVEGELTAGGRVTATCRGTFVAVGPGHPAYDRWIATKK